MQSEGDGRALNESLSFFTYSVIQNRETDFGMVAKEL